MLPSLGVVLGLVIRWTSWWGLRMNYDGCRLLIVMNLIARQSARNRALCCLFLMLIALLMRSALIAAIP